MPKYKIVVPYSVPVYKARIKSYPIPRTLHNYHKPILEPWTRLLTKGAHYRVSVYIPREEERWNVLTTKGHGSMFALVLEIWITIIDHCQNEGWQGTSLLLFHVCTWELENGWLGLWREKPNKWQYKDSWAVALGLTGKDHNRKTSPNIRDN